jgi:hypothetical protein
VKKIAFILLLVLVNFTLVKANDPADSVHMARSGSRPWFSPDYIPFQYAGNLGWVSTGIGYRTRKDNYQVSFVYGYAPAAVSGIDVHLVSAKNIFHFYKFPLDDRQALMAYGALGLSLEIGGQSFFTVPSNMPEGYYHFPKSIHVIPAAGIKLRRGHIRLKGFSGIEFFVEASTIDALVFYKATSRNVALSEILSSSFGIHLLRM